VALLRERPELGPVTTAGRVSDQLVLAALAEALDRDARLVSARARAVLDHDARHATSYAALLGAYLDAGRDVAVTAELLTVHPNTVRYRLRRAAELFGLDLGDPEQALPLWLALRSGGGASRPTVT
jgi:DNA-binding PucR family transcriptional regulator